MSDQPTAYVVVDPKGDTIEATLASLALSAPHRLTDVRYLDPFSEGGFPFNLNKLPLGKTPLDIRATQLANLVATVSTATGSQASLGAGARQLDVLVNVILAALSCIHPQANVLWALDSLIETDGFPRLGMLATSDRAKQFLASAKLSEELRASSASRLRSAFAATEMLERLMSADSCIDFDDLTAPGRITLVHLGSPPG